MPKIVTEEKKREIKRMLEEGRSYTDIKETLHVGQKTIDKVKLEMKGGGKNLPFLRKENNAYANSIILYESTRAMPVLQGR